MSRKCRPNRPPPGSEKIKFTLRGITVQNATVYSEAQLLPLYQDRVGQTVSLADMYGIAGDLTRKYRNDGYILTQIVVPPQTIDNGIVRFQAVEGYVDQITVQGGQDNARPLIQQIASKISNGGPMNVAQMERALLLINDLPGITARGVLSPSKTKPGAADLTVILDRKPFDAEVFANNYGTRYLGPYQLGGAGALNSPFGMNERITGQIVYAPSSDISRELAYAALGYMQPIGTNGTTVSLDASYSDTEPGFSLEQFDVKGTAKYLAAKISHPFIRSRNTNLTGHVTFDIRNVDTEDNLVPEREDRIRALRIGARYDHLTTWLGTAYNVADIQFSHGLDMFGATNSGDLNSSRPDANEDFTKFELELQRLQRINGSINVLAGIQGQWTSDALLSSEEMGIGGMSYGRGYDPSEIIGDKGFAGKIEVQWKDPIAFPMIQDWQLYAFYDVGTVWNEDATTSADKRNSIASTGLGARLNLTPQASMDILLAQPLTRDVETYGDKDARAFVGLNYRF